MIKLKNFLLAFMAVTVMFTLACGGDDGPSEPTAEEQRIIDLAGTTGTTWTATSITQDGAPANGLDNFSITFRSGTSLTYSASNSTPLIAASGPWEFNNGNISQIIFNGDSDNVFNVSNLNTTATPATMTLTVNFTNPNGGTAAGASGTYVFNLQAQ
ncbi:MAG: hypothetical protein Roseis2KO_35630 [Roseivirga sp.]